jgi:hypothetical protein
LTPKLLIEFDMNDSGKTDIICMDKEKQSPEVCHAGTTAYHGAKVKHFDAPGT